MSNYVRIAAGPRDQPQVPMVRRRLDNIDWTETAVRLLLASGGTDNYWLARIITESRTRAGHVDGPATDMRCLTGV